MASRVTYRGTGSWFIHLEKVNEERREDRWSGSARGARGG